MAGRVDRARPPLIRWRDYGWDGRRPLFVFGHVGLTWGGSLLLIEAGRRLPLARRLPLDQVASAVDYRLVIAGSMLPDVVDKPLGVFVLGDEVSSGRAFAHSLAFVSAIALASLLRRGAARRLLAPVALGAAAHLVFDRMWREPRTLLWPLLGWRIERVDVSGWWRQMLEQLFADPYTYVSEVAGAAVVVALMAFLARRGRLRDFLSSGRMGPAVAGGTVFGLAGQERPRELQGRQRPAER